MTTRGSRSPAWARWAAWSIGTRRQTDSVDGKQVFHTASTVGSVEGNVLIKAGNGLNVVGSNVIARQAT